MGARKHSSKSSNGVANRTVNVTKENYSQLLERAIKWLLNDGIFANLSTHGNTSWQFASLVSLAVLWVWSDQSQLTAKFENAHRLSIKLFGRSPFVPRNDASPCKKIRYDHSNIVGPSSHANGADRWQSLACWKVAPPCM